MHPIQAFILNPVKVTVAVLLLALFGIIGLIRMPMQLTPEVQIPTISVSTRWPGASPQEVEREIIQEQEEQLKAVEGVTKMSSESMDSSGTITLEFRVGTNMEEALLKVNSRLQQVPEYPEDSDEPVIRTSSSSDRAIAWFILSARMPNAEAVRAFIDEHPELSGDLNPVLAAHSPALAELRLRRAAAQHAIVKNELLPPPIDLPAQRKFAEDQIETQFERVDGVSNSNVLGGRDPELQVVVDPQRLAARQLTISNVRDALRAQNKDTSGGDFWEGKRRWVVRTLGQFRNPEQVENQVLAVVDGDPVYVRDVAEVRIGQKKPDGFVRRYGNECIAINVIRDSGANVLQVMRGLREANERLNAGVLETQGLTLTQVYDETEYIDSAVSLVNQNIVLGGALTVIILMLFLHIGSRTLLFAPLLAGTAIAAVVVSPWFFLVTLALIIVAGFWFARGALVVSLAIPVSIVGTFLVLQQLGRSLNVISLAGLAFAVGMLVDNAVVVLENIYRHYQDGDGAFAAAERATKEVWGAVAASTLTTLAVFLPVLFVQEEAGQLFRDIALAISSAVALSLVVSVTVIPTAAARLLTRRERGSSDGTISIVERLLTSFGSRFVDAVVGLNARVQKSTIARLLVVGVLVGTSVVLSIVLWPKVEYLPTGNRNLIICLVLPPPGYNLDQLGQLGKTVEDELQLYWDIDPDSPEAAALDFPAVRDFFYVARGRSVFLGLRCGDAARVDELIPLITGGVNPRNGVATPGLRSKLPGTLVIANKSSLFESGLTGGRSIDIEITGPELTRLVGIGGRIFGQVRELIPGSQVQPIPSLDLSNPEMHVIPHLLQAADMGVTAVDLGYATNAFVDGAWGGYYYQGGDKIDLTIMGDQDSVNQTQDLQEIPIATPGGQLVPLGALAAIEYSSGPEQVNHRERQRAITIRVKPPDNVALEDALSQITEEVIEPLEASGELGTEYTLALSGTADKLRETWNAMRWNFLLALLITYLLMAALFESWLYPFVIILSVPLGAVGGIIGLNLLNLYLQTMSGQTQTLDVLTMLGFVILIGTVVNNAILIVHQSLNHMREDDLDPQAAILESVRTRIRPIFMTTLTTVFGLAPLVLFPGAGSELYRGLGSVVLGGLIVSTVFTLFLIPTLFSLMMDAKKTLTSLVGWTAASERQ
ncbi:MAG: efflux RND transporter permease subunit [Planctomycetes bacterium]|nr:efflux RND transporter permease subunit [Planctomycetota bacterium]